MTPLERVQDALRGHGSRRSGPSGWTCPAHDDRQASLSVAAGTDGKVIINCHAECRPEAVLAALGLEWADLFPQPEVGTRLPRAIVATYPYVDERGRPLFEVVRFAPKDFRQRRSDGHGGWIWNLQGTRRVLYRLPRVLDAVALRKTIYVVEGEKDVHSLEQAGAVATCNPMGAGKWHGDYAQALAGASVVVVSDRDDAGRRHARTVAASLTRVGCAVQVVEPAEGKDATDHLAGHTLDEFIPVDLDGPPPASGGGGTIADLLEVMSGYLHLDDPDHILFALAVATSAELEGPPVWGMLVGAPSGGKTEAIEVLKDRAVHLDELTAAGLLSWQPAKPPRPTGALIRLGARGLLTIGDLSTLVASTDRSGSAREQLFANLRRIYDGSLVRDLGNAPGPLYWEGRATILAGCTPAIDRYAAYADQLGPRFLYFRLRAATTAAERARQRKVRDTAGTLEERRKEARRLAGEIVHHAAERARSLELPEPMTEAIFDAAYVTTLGRASVPRYGFGKREIDGLPVVESTPRVTGQLLMLARCALALGLDEPGALALCCRVALDSMPEVRRRALEELAGGELLTGREVARRVQCHPTVGLRTLEDLEAIGIVAAERDGDDGDEDPGGGFPTPTVWHLSGPDAPMVASVMAGQPVHEVDNTSPPPPLVRGENPDIPSDGQGQSQLRVQGAPDGRLLDPGPSLDDLARWTR